MHLDLLEPLEPRMHFAGNVNITTTEANILIQGDNRANNLVINLLDNGSGNLPLGLSIIDNDNGSTKLFHNGTRVARVDLFTQPFGNRLMINLFDGDDVILFENTFPDLIEFGATTIQSGKGNDFIGGASTFTSLAIDAGPGDDAIRLIEGTVVKNNFSIDGSLGRDEVRLDSLAGDGPQIGGKLWIQGTSGPTTVLLKKAFVRKNFIISTGNSLDRVNIINSSFKGPVTIGTHGGDDIIDLTGSFFRSTKDIFAGTGKDTIIP